MIRLGIVATIMVTVVVADGARLDALAASAKAKTDRSEIHSWQTVIGDLREEARGFLGTLKLVRTALIRRAEREDRRVIGRLYLKRPIRAGYGVVPEIVKEPPERPVALLKTEFSLQALAARTKRDLTALFRLNKRAATDRGAPLMDLVKAFERLRGRLRNLERNLSYHNFWQRSAIRKPRYYAERNKLAIVIGELMALRKKAADPERQAALQRRIRDRVFRIRKVRPGLAPTIKEIGDGALVLPVTIFTDIADEGFLNGFSESVRDLVSRSPTARKRQFSIDLRLRRMSINELYPDGAPRPGASIDRKSHLARFPKDAYVLTTGGRSTHVYTDRAIMLGPSPASRRTLAHEFLHLFGFLDAYVRSYTGDLKDPFGVTFVEWTGLTDDIMSSPGHGRVSDEIIETLIEAYFKRPAAGAAAR